MVRVSFRRTVKLPFTTGPDSSSDVPATGLLCRVRKVVLSKVLSMVR